METTYTEKMSARHILVIISGIMMTFSCTAMVFSTWSAFQAVVPEMLGVEKATWAAYVTVLYVTSAVASPFVGKIMPKVDMRVLLSASVALMGGGFLVIWAIRQLWAFYLAGFMMGLGAVSVLWLAIPTMFGNWFNQRSGTFIGLCMAFTGIGGALCMQHFNALYAGGEGVDVWTIYLIWGVIALAGSLPFTLLFVRRTPQEVGELPYGKPQTKSGKPAGLSASKAMHLPVFYSVFMLAGIINLLTMVAQQFPTYTKSLTDVPFDVLSVGIMMATVMMVAQAISKFALGVAVDKSVKGSFFAATVAGVVGVLLVWFGFESPAMLYSGAAVYGFFFASCMVLIPQVVRHVFGSREYAEIYSRIGLFLNITGALGPVFWAFLGRFGFPLLFSVAVVLLVVVIALGVFTFARAKAVQDQWTE